MAANTVRFQTLSRHHKPEPQRYYLGLMETAQMISERGARAALAQRVVRDTGISEEQARTLISDLGCDWSSLVREARIMRKSAAL